MRHWPWVGLAVGAFCLVRGGIDIFDQNYLLGVLGIGAGFVLLLTPIPTRAVKFDLPPPAGD